MEDRNNIDLIYSYTESFLKDRDASLRSLNTKCAGLVALSGILLNPFLVISHCIDCAHLRAGILVSLLAGIVSGLIGLFASPCGDVVSPTELYYDFYYKSEQECRQFIIGSWHTAIDQLTKQGIFKGRCFNTGVVFLIFAISFAFISGSLVLALPKP